MTKAARVAQRKGKSDRKRIRRLKQGNYKGTIPTPQEME